ncbi:hypothetical protein SMC4_04355, partial [Candidatus Cryosericum hinesii]
MRQGADGKTGEHSTRGWIKRVEAAAVNVEAPDGSASYDRRSAAHAALRDPADSELAVGTDLDLAKSALARDVDRSAVLGRAPEPAADVR